MLKRFLGVIFALLFVASFQASADTPSSPLAETEKLLASKPELKAWFDTTAKKLEVQLRSLARQAEKFEDPDGFGIAKDKKAEKKLGDDELNLRRKKALQAVIDYANKVERHLLTILTASKIAKYECVQKRVLRSPEFTFELFRKEDPLRTAVFVTTKSLSEGGKTKVHAQKLLFSSRALLPTAFAETLSHELTHLFIQMRDTEDNPEFVVFPTVVRLDLAAVKYPAHRYKKSIYIEHELVAEGITELRSQQCVRLMGENVYPVSYQHALGLACVMVACDEDLVMQWYTGSLTTKEFYDRYRKSLGDCLQKHRKFDAAEADRVTFGLLNLALDGRNTKVFSQTQGAHADIGVTMQTFVRALLDAGYVTRDVFDRADAPDHVMDIYFPKK